MTVGVPIADLASVDLTDLGLWAGGPPYALFARMRSEAPVRWNPSADGVGFWSLTRAADIRQVNQDAETFSSARGGIFPRPGPLAPIRVRAQLPDL
jgi:cytochrome P450